LERKEKLEMLRKLSEKDLTKNVLIPLFEKMEFINIKYTHGTLEYGKDIISQTMTAPGDEFVDLSENRKRKIKIGVTHYLM